MPRNLALHHVTAARAEVVLLACGLSRHQRAYVLDGFRFRAACRFVDSFDALDRMLPSMTRCDAVILSPTDQNGRDAIGTVQRIAREWPGTAIVVFSPARGHESPAPSIKSLALAGAHQFVFEGVFDTASALIVAVENARRECAADAVFLRLQALIPPVLHSLAHAVVSRPEMLLSIEDVAVALGIHRKTLAKRCLQCDFIPPAELVGWCRLAMVGYMLDRTGSTIESISLSLGFPSHTALRNLLKRYVGFRATEIRRQGALKAVLDAFTHRIESRRGVAVSIM